MMQFPAIPAFKDGGTLDEKQLYSLLAAAFSHDRLAVAALGRHGFFRPPSPALVEGGPLGEPNLVELDGRTLRICNLALLNRHGTVFLAPELDLRLIGRGRIEVGLCLRVPADWSSFQSPGLAVEPIELGSAEAVAEAEADPEKVRLCWVEGGAIQVLPPLLGLRSAAFAGPTVGQLDKALASYRRRLVEHGLQEGSSRGHLLSRLEAVERRIAQESSTRNEPWGGFWHSVASLIEAAYGFHLRIAHARNPGLDSSRHADLDEELRERVLSAEPLPCSAVASLRELRSGSCQYDSGYRQLAYLKQLADTFGPRGSLHSTLAGSSRILMPLSTASRDIDGDRTIERYPLDGLDPGSRLRIFVVDASEDIYLYLDDRQDHVRPLPRPERRGNALTIDIEVEEGATLNLWTRREQVRKVEILREDRS